MGRRIHMEDDEENNVGNRDETINREEDVAEQGQRGESDQPMREGQRRGLDEDLPKQSDR